MVRALSNAIREGNSEGIEATEMLSLVESILDPQKKLEIDRNTAMLMLDALFLMYGIG